MSNKLKLGNTVKAKGNWVKWMSSHLYWYYGRRVGGDKSYGEGEKEIYPEDFDEIYAFLHYRLFNVAPKGKVIGYGSNDQDERGNRLKKKFVLVEFTLRTKKKLIKHSHYCSERDLVKIK